MDPGGVFKCGFSVELWTPLHLDLVCRQVVTYFTLSTLNPTMSVAQPLSCFARFVQILHSVASEDFLGSFKVKRCVFLFFARVQAASFSIFCGMFDLCLVKTSVYLTHTLCHTHCELWRGKKICGSCLLAFSIFGADALWGSSDLVRSCVLRDLMTSGQLLVQVWTPPGCTEEHLRSDHTEEVWDACDWRVGLSLQKKVKRV